APTWSDEKAHLNSRSPKVHRRRVWVNSAREDRGRATGAGLTAPTADANSSRWYLSRRAMSRHFRLTGFMEYLAPFAVQAALTPANLPTLAHFSVSSAISLPMSAGEPASAVPPSSASRVLIFKSARPALISWFSLSMISFGAFFGAPKPHHALASYPWTNSATVGTSGSASERVAVV